MSHKLKSQGAEQVKIAKTHRDDFGLLSAVMRRRMKFTRSTVQRNKYSCNKSQDFCLLGRLTCIAEVNFWTCSLLAVSNCLVTALKSAAITDMRRDGKIALPQGGESST